MAQQKLETQIEYYNNGTIKCAYAVNENGQKQGPFEEYHENGQLKKKCTYKDGSLYSPFEEYWANGQLKIKGTYKGGLYEGPFEAYHDNGQLKLKCTYKNGFPDGPYEEYDKNGQLSYKIIYEYGTALTGKNAERYLKEWIEKPQKERKGLNARLDQISKQMKPSALRKNVKRAEVAKFRAKFPNKKDGR